MYYPVNLNLKGKRCVVIGGGQVAYRKIRFLIECGAEVLVVSRKLIPALVRLKEQGSIQVLDKDYDSNYLCGAYLVFGTTGDRKVNSRISQDAKSAGILVNISDAKDESTFVLPSVLKRGEFQIAVSTGGLSPALSRKVREDLEGVFGDEYARFLELLGRLRSEIKKVLPVQGDRASFWRRVVESECLKFLKEGKDDTARALIEEMLREVSTKKDRGNSQPRS